MMKIRIRNLKYKSLSDLNLRTKIVIAVNLLLLFFLVVFGLYFYISQKNRIVKSTDQFMFNNVSQLKNIVSALDPVVNGSEQIIHASVDESFAGVIFSKKQDSIRVMVPRIVALEAVNKGLNDDLNSIYTNSINKVFNDISYYNSGYPFIVGKDGELLVHPTLEGENISEASFFNKMVSQGQIQGKIKYTWPETRFGEEKVLYYQYFEPLDAYISASFYENAMFKELNSLKITLLLAIGAILVMFSLAVWFLMKPIVSKIKILVNSINTLAAGKLINKFNTNANDEVGEIMKSVDRLTENLKKNADFANEIGKGRLDSEFQVIGEDDVLGSSLIEMRKSLKQSKEEEEKRKQEEDKQNWSSRGLAKFNDILRSNDSLSILGDKLTSEIVEYLEANQCGLFVVNQDDKKEVELVSAYAYNRKKFLSKKISVGEGVAGTCIKEGKTIYLKDIPDDYIEITSGLGKATPRELLVVPLRHEDNILGVLEVASFKPFEQYEVEFVEQVAGTIASSVSNVMINENTNKLLEQAHQQAEQLAAQEEEMRQTMEELTATQEEMQRKNKQMEEMNQSFINNETALKQQIEDASAKEKELKDKIAEQTKLIQDLESNM